MPDDDYVFGPEDTGPYSNIYDTRDVLARFMDGLGEDELAGELRGEPSDDYSEEEDAIDALNENTAEGFSWGIHPDEPGVLMLQAEEWWEQ
jgi:hypothetical protein